MSNSSPLATVLKEMVGEANLTLDQDRLGAYAVDGMTPKAVVCPGSVEEVSKLLAYATAEKLAVVPRGNGTTMAQGGIPRKLDLVLSMLRINRITEHDIPNLSLSVQAGMTLSEVQKALAGTGKGSFLPLDPPYSEAATIGGIVATNGSGPRRYLYSTARDLLLGLKAVSPTGDIVAFGGKTVKNVSGYDMTKLMIGSFGALGVITEITTKLLPLPEASATLLTSFDDLTKAGSLTRKILHSPLLPSAIELMDGRAAGYLGEKGPYLVAFSLEGVEEAVERQVVEIGALAKGEGAFETKTLKGKEDRGFWIQVRDLPLVTKAPLILKSNVVISRLPEIMGHYEKTAKAAGVGCAFVGHAGNGILTTHLWENGAAAADRLPGLIAEFTAEAAKHDGNLVVASCPVGLKTKISLWGQPRSDYRVMRRLKEKLDPAGVLNPGRFVGGI